MTAQDVVELSSLSNWALGSHLKLKSLNDQIYEGQLYCCDFLTSTVVLQTISHKSTASSATTTSKPNFHILKINFIKEVTLVSDIPADTDGSGPSKGHLQTMSAVSIEKLAQREHNVLRAEKEKHSRIGVGVSLEAQNIFDSLSKTLPCRWDGNAIIVMDEIKIDPPYNTKHVHILHDKVPESVLARVKKVLEGERKRLKLGV